MLGSIKNIYINKQYLPNVTNIYINKQYLPNVTAIQNLKTNIWVTSTNLSF